MGFDKITRGSFLGDVHESGYRVSHDSKHCEHSRNARGTHVSSQSRSGGFFLIDDLVENDSVPAIFGLVGRLIGLGSRKVGFGSGVCPLWSGRMPIASASELPEVFALFEEDFVNTHDF